MSRLSLMLLKMSQSDTKKERKKKKGKDKKDSDENVGDEGSPLEVSSSKKLSLEADAMNTAHKASTSSVNDQLEEGKVKSITELLEKKTATRVSSQNQLANKSEEARKTMIKSRLQAGQARQRARDASAAKDVNSEPNGEEPMKNREAIEEARRARKKAILESRKISAKNREAATDEAQLANNDVVKTRRKASLGRGRDSIGNTDALKYNIEVTKATDEVPTVTDELPSSNDEFPTIDEALTVNDEDLTSKDDEPVTKGEISSIKSEISSQTSPHFDSQKVKTKNSDVKTSTKESQNMLNVIKEEPNTERIVSAKGSRSNTLTDDKVMDLARELVSNTAESIRTLIQDERQRSSEVQRIDSQAENVSNTAGRVEERDQAGETQNSETLADFVSRSVHSLVRLRKEQSAIETLETIKTILESSTSLAQTKKVSSNSVEVQTQREPASMLHTQEATKLPSGADVLTAFVSNEDVNNQRKLNLNNAMYFDDCLNVDSEKNNDKMRFKESCKLNCSLCSTNKSLSKARCVPCLSTCRNCFRPVKAKKHLAQANEGQCSTTFRDSFDLQEARQGFQEQSLMKSRYVTVQGSGPPNFTQVSGPPNFTQVSGQPNYVRGNGQSNCIESNGQSNCIRGNVQSKCTKGCGSTNCSQASGPHNFTQVSSPSIYAQSSIPHNLTQGTCPTNCGQCRNPLFCSLKNQSNQRSQSRDGRTSSMDQRNIVSNTNGINTSKIDVNNMSQDQDNAMHCYNQCHNYEATQLNQARNHELNSVKQGLNYEMNQSLPDQCVRQELNYATNQSLGVDENTRMDDVQQDEQILQEASHNPRSLKKERCSPGKTEMPSKEVFQGYCSCLQNIEADEQCCCAMRQCASIHPNQNDAVKESNKPQEENKQLAQEVKPVCQFTFIPYESEPSRDSLLSGSTNFIDGRLYIDVCNTYPLISSSSHQFENEYKQEPVTDKLVCDMGTPQALSCDYELLSPDTCEKPCYKSDEISERCECHSQNSKQKTKTDIRSSSKLDKNVLGKICQINKLCNYKLSNECKNPESTCVDKQNQHVQNVGSVKPSDGCKRQTRDAECIYPDIAENLQCESEDANSERKLLNDVVSNDSSDCPTVPTSKVDACTDVKDLPSMEVSSCHVSCNVCEDFKELLQESSSNEETESCTVSSVGTVHRSTEPAQRSKHFKTFSRPTWKKHVQLSDGDDDGSLSPNRYCKHQKDDKKRTTDRGFRIEDDMLVYGSRTAKVRMAGNETDYERYRKHLHGSLTHLDNTRGDSPCNDERTTASDFSGEEDNQEPVGRCMRCKRALNLEASDDTDDYMPKRSRSLDFERYQNCRAKQNTCSERDNYCYEVDSEFNVPSLTECCMKHSRYKKYSKTNQRRSHGQSVTKYQRDRREDSYEHEYGADPTEVMYVRCESPKPSHYVDEIGFVKEKRGHSRSPARQHREYVEPEKVCRSQRTCDCNEDHEESFANDHYKGYPVSHRSMYAGKAESRDPTYHRMEENEENCATKMQSQSPYQSDFSTERSDRFYYNDKSASASKARSHPMAGFKAQAEVPKQNSLLPEDTSKVVYAPISPRGQAKLCLSQTPQWSPNDTKRSSNCCQGLFRNQSGYQMLGVYKEVDERSNSSKVPQQYQHYPDSSQRIPRGCFMNREEERET